MVVLTTTVVWFSHASRPGVAISGNSLLSWLDNLSRMTSFYGTRSCAPVVQYQLLQGWDMFTNNTDNYVLQEN